MVNAWVVSGVVVAAMLAAVLVPAWFQWRKLQRERATRRAEWDRLTKDMWRAHAGSGVLHRSGDANG